MRVLSIGSMYPPHHLGGYELTWLSAVEHLRSAGHEVRVLASDYRRPDAATGRHQHDVHRSLRWYWCDHAFPRMSPRLRLDLERHNAKVFTGHVHGFRPDVVSWWAMGGMSLSLLERARRARLPSVAVVGDEWPAYGPRVDAWCRLFHRFRRLGSVVDARTGLPTEPNFRAVDRWLFNSDVTRRSAMASGHPIRGAEIAHPGIDHGLFRPAPAGPWRGSLLYVGRIDERKGIDTAVRALSHLGSEVTLTVLGGGDEGYLRRLRELAGGLGVGERVRFAEVRRERLPGEYAAHDALIFPVRWEEPWGLVPLEAMAVGVPVVATGTGGSGEYLEHGQNCVIFKPRDSAASLAAAVRALGDDEELRDRVRRGGRRTAARFTEEAYNEAIRKALECAAAAAAEQESRRREKAVRNSAQVD